MKIQFIQVRDHLINNKRCADILVRLQPLLESRGESGQERRHSDSYKIDSNGILGAASRVRRAFTLVEVMVAMAIFSLVMIGAIYGHIFGLKMRQITSAKLGASDEARAAISKLTEEIRAASWVEVGNVGSGGSVLTNFTEIPPLTPQQGNAIRIFPILNNTNVFTIYYWETNWFKKMASDDDANSSFVIAHSISNKTIFTSEDYLGRTNLTQSNGRLIGLALDFYQLQYPTVEIGPGRFYDYYQLRTKVTRRSTQ